MEIITAPWQSPRRTGRLVRAVEQINIQTPKCVTMVPLQTGKTEFTEDPESTAEL